MKTKEMFVHTLHNLETGHIRARGYDLRPGDTLAALIDGDLLTWEGLWDTFTVTYHSENKATIHARDGITTTYRPAPDVDITIYIAR